MKIGLYITLFLLLMSNALAGTISASASTTTPAPNQAVQITYTATSAFDSYFAGFDGVTLNGCQTSNGQSTFSGFIAVNNGVGANTFSYTVDMPSTGTCTITAPYTITDEGGINSATLTTTLAVTEGGGSCTPNWNTGDWSECVNNQQSRTVTDSNNCGTTSGKPITERACTVGDDGSSSSCEAWEEEVDGACAFNKTFLWIGIGLIGLIFLLKL